ncbi:hypothetical protein [Pseudomonas sp. B329]|uniref:hypothetical protein n=1 Tax=Pseudomonas sp. B329 TaxID=1553459 RepID=UPI0020040E6F|nr:hypothetical protein [Pseudomonas sp. B329]MCK3864667.1 hypothetical protein [Pseudomonas sp. B329]
MKILRELIEAGDPLVQQAVEALRQYHAAQSAGAPAKDIERLRCNAESLFQAVNEYQRCSLGGLPSTRH